MDYEERYRRMVLRMRMRQDVAMRSAFIRVAKKFADRFSHVPIVRGVERFSFKTNPKLNAEITAMMGEFQTELYENITGGMKKGWGLGDELNDQYVAYYFSGLAGFQAQKTAMMARNTEAMEAFINRKYNSRSLSDRVWKIANRYRDELEANLLVGVADGKSSKQIATQIKEYLHRPDDLFRRVRDDKGNLRLSRAAKLLTPGKGMYRSSYRNALRVSATEVNRAYRRADNLRWQKMDFIIGYDVKLSPQHPRYDICDELEGRYPKGFFFGGWHPRCFCHVYPVRMPREDFQRRLRGESVQIHPVSKMPGAFRKWLSENRDRVGKMKNRPYFIQENRKWVK